MLLASVTLMPTGPDRVDLTSPVLRELILHLAGPDDRIEHVRVIERDGVFRVGAYASIADQHSAQRNLDRICARATERLPGWALAEPPDRP